MNKRVNFEDNIFILTMRIRMIRDIITLDADPELFLEKILDDIDFTDHVLRILLGYLEESSRLLTRDEFLEQLSELEWQFSQTIGEILNHEGNISVREIRPVYDKLVAYRQSSKERVQKVETLSMSGNFRSGDPIVSSDELAELLKVY